MNTQKGFASIIVLLIVFLLAGGGYVAYRMASAPALPSVSALPSQIPQSAISGKARSAANASPADFLQGPWKPERFSIFDPTLGQYRETPPPNNSYIEFKGNLSCPDGGIDAKGMPLACRKYAPFSIEGGTIVVQEGNQTIKLAFAFSGDKLELVMQPLSGSGAQRTKMILTKWLGVTVPSSAAAANPSSSTTPTPAPSVFQPSEAVAPSPVSVTPKPVPPAPLSWPQVTAADLAKSCNGVFNEYAPSTSRDGEYHYYFERKESNLDLQIYVEVLDLRSGVRPYDWMTAGVKYQSELKRDPPYVIASSNFAGDESALIPDAGVGAKAVARKGDYFMKFEERARTCTPGGCAMPTCTAGFPDLTKVVIGRLAR